MRTFGLTMAAVTVRLVGAAGLFWGIGCGAIALFAVPLAVLTFRTGRAGAGLQDLSRSLSFLGVAAAGLVVCFVMQAWGTRIENKALADSRERDRLRALSRKDAAEAKKQQAWDESFVDPRERAPAGAGPRTIFRLFHDAGKTGRPTAG